MMTWADVRQKRRADAAAAGNMANMIFLFWVCFGGTEHLARVIVGEFQKREMRVTMHLDANDGDNEWIKVVVEALSGSRTEGSLDRFCAIPKMESWMECCGTTDGLDQVPGTDIYSFATYAFH